MGKRSTITSEEREWLAEANRKAGKELALFALTICGFILALPIVILVGLFYACYQEVVHNEVSSNVERP